MRGNNGSMRRCGPGWTSSRGAFLTNINLGRQQVVYPEPLKLKPNGDRVQEALGSNHSRIYLISLYLLPWGVLQTIYKHLLR